MRFSSERSEYYYNNVLLNEGAYFFRIEGKLTKNQIKEIFAKVKKDESLLAKEIKKDETLNSGKKALCSFLLFYHTTESNLIPQDKVKREYKLSEKRIGYLLIIEIENFIVLVKKNIAGISGFINSLSFISGTELTGAIANKDSVFNQVKVSNMSTNPNALRNKSYEGNDLRNSMPQYGQNRNVLNTTRFETNGETTTINLGTARICQFGRKDIHELCNWAEGIVNGIKHPNDLTNTLFDGFAQPVSWKAKYGELTPSSLLIDVHALMNLRQSYCLTLFYKEDKGEDLSQLFDKIIKRLDVCFNLSKTADNQFVCDKSLKLLEVKVSKANITLSCKGTLRDIYVKDNEGKTNRLITYISTHRCFFVGFDKVEYIYYGNQLHEDKKLMNNLHAILSVFKPIKELNSVTSEKGNVHNNGNEFEVDTVFYAVEHYFKSQGASNIICDDLGNEWADHIITKDDTLYFVHSKAKGKIGLSASNFQDVIAQALKNIGNMNSDIIDSKKDRFRGKYSTTEKNQCRLGSVDDFVSEYKRINLSPNGRKVVGLAIDFIDKDELEKVFNDMEGIKKNNYVVQLIWLLYSFISSCKDAGLGCQIFCKGNTDNPEV